MQKQTLTPVQVSQLNFLMLGLSGLEQWIDHPIGKALLEERQKELASFIRNNEPAKEEPVKLSGIHTSYKTEKIHLGSREQEELEDQVIDRMQ